MESTNIIGKKFSLLTVIEEIKPIKKIRQYICKCDCGRFIKKSRSNIISKNKNKSCGCMSNIWRAEAKRTHGERYTLLYKVWQGVKSRSVNSGTFNDRKQHDEYKRKNITMCEEWLKYENFSKWAKETGYSENSNLSIDRKDNEKGYYPENCRWTTANIQARNTKVIWSTNKTGYRGVSLTTRKKNPYRCLIYVDKKQISLGQYNNPIDAAKAYNKYVLDNDLEHNINIIEDDSHAQHEIRLVSEAMKSLVENNNG